VDDLADGVVFIVGGDQAGDINGADLPTVESAGMAGVALGIMIVGEPTDTVVIQQLPSASDTGIWDCYIWYIPLSPGATVVAAA